MEEPPNRKGQRGSRPTLRQTPKEPTGDTDREVLWSVFSSTQRTGLSKTVSSFRQTNDSGIYKGHGRSGSHRWE